LFIFINFLFIFCCAGYNPGLDPKERAESLATMDRLIRKGKRLRDARKKLLRKGKNSSKPKVIVIKEGKKSQGDKYDTWSYIRTANKGPVRSNINVSFGISSLSNKIRN
jgi:hypothetical protein